MLINAIMLGLSRREARERFDDIIAFAELEEFLDLKLKNYSSGMHVRLAFAVATQVDADVLLIDEVLAVGDAAFQQKCFDQFRTLKAAGRTIVLRHARHARRRALLRPRDAARARGGSSGSATRTTIAQAYNEINFGRFVAGRRRRRRYGDRREAEITGAWFEDARRRAGPRAGARASRCASRWRSGSARRSRSRCSASRSAHDAGHTVFATRTDMQQVPTGRFEAGDVAIVRVRVRQLARARRYRLTPSLARAGAGTEALDAREDLALLTRRTGRATSGGIVDLPHAIAIERHEDGVRSAR